MRIVTIKMYAHLGQKLIWFLLILSISLSYAQECVSGSIIYNNTTDKFNFCENGNWTEKNGVVDIDGNAYNTVKIGNQWWMAENLKVTHYRNGNPIPNVTDDTEWSNLTTGAYCSYDNNDSNINTYGLLYNWYSVDDSRGLAPAGICDR